MSIVPVPTGTRVGSPAFCGQSAAYVDFDATEENLVDFQTDSVTRIAGPEHSVTFGDPVMSANWIAWASWRQASNSNSEGSREPLHWVISAVPASDASAKPIQVGSGTNVEPPFPVQPLMAIDGDLLAYTVESPQAGHPQADAVVVHDLATGADVARIQTAESVWALDLSADNIIYSEGIIDQDAFWTDTRVMLALGAQAPTEIAKGGYEVAIDGQRLVWDQVPTDGSSITAGQAVMTATVSDLRPQQLSRQSTQSQTFYGYWPAAGEDMVTWHDSAQGQPDDHLEVWDPDTNSTVPVFRPAIPTVSGLCGGWLGWYSSVETPDGNAFDALYGVPVDAVKRLLP